MNPIILLLRVKQLAAITLLGKAYVYTTVSFIENMPGYAPEIMFYIEGTIRLQSGADKQGLELRLYVPAAPAADISKLFSRNRVYKTGYTYRLNYSKFIIELSDNGCKTGINKGRDYLNREMSYLLGMICGNGQIRRGNTETTVSIEIPHRKLATENNNDVRIYVRASITDIRTVLEPLIDTGLNFTQQDKYSIISFTKRNDEYTMREILRYIGNAVSHENIEIHSDVFSFTHDEKISFLQGFADVTGYIRRSNYFFDHYMHRVYLEVPHNWYLVIDICRLLEDVNIPVQAIDWAHPNMRDGNLIKYNQGKPDFWKKEHQIKIWANEFLPIGFAVIHKREALAQFAAELTDGLISEGKTPSEVTHKFYWEVSGKSKSKPHHPGESDNFIPAEIRGRHYDSWKQIAADLGYGE